MNKRAKTIRILIAAVLTAMFVISGLITVATAVNVPFPKGAYMGIAVAGTLMAALCALASISVPGLAVAAVLLIVIGIFWAMANRVGLLMIDDFFALWQGGEMNTARAALGGQAFFCLVAVALGGIFYLLLYRRQLTPVAVMLLAAMLVAAHAMSNTASIAATVPGLIAGAAAFALTGGAPRDSGAVRVLVPSVLAALLALALLPGGRVTWSPLEEAGNRVKAIFEQYFNFDYERKKFYIDDEGYNHGGEIDGQAVAMLGGPAQPKEEAVMRVTSDGNILLRGTIRATYTGYSWIDNPRDRNLYFELTHLRMRNRAFDAARDVGKDAFHAREAQVEMLSEGTSTLFVPGRLTRFRMNLSNAVYYNSAGELFLTRDVKPGDKYSVQGMIPVYGDALRKAVQRGKVLGDEWSQAMLAEYTALPAGIEDHLSALTIEITRRADNAYDRAAAIADYLRQNMRYSLDVDYPPVGRDFVSWFVLDSKEGYCSYFASAMAVMGRIVGLPTRYVEGYYARPGSAGSVVLDGRDAHAWAEVYFRGVGWVPFDATGGVTARNDKPESEDGSAVPDTMEEEVPEATEAPASDSQSGGMIAFDTSQFDAPEQTPPPPEDDPSEDTQEDEPEDNTQDDTQDDTDAPEDDTPDEPPPQDDDADRPARRLPWLAIALPILLLAVVILWVWHRLARANPMVLCDGVRRSQQAAMIVYRANLTLLSYMGQVPINGETPEAFAERMSRQFDNLDFEHFVRATMLNRYGNRSIRRVDVDAGLRAYRTFEKSMGRFERLKYGMARIFHGLGDFESIP